MTAYEPGRRSGLWMKHRVNLSQDFVIGGYVPSRLGVDSIVIGLYRDKQLRYTAGVRAASCAEQTNVQAESNLGNTQVADESAREGGRTMGQGLTGREVNKSTWHVKRR